MKINFNNNTWINYLHKKGILKEGLRNFKENEIEKKEFMAMIRRLEKYSQNVQEKKL